MKYFIPITAKGEKINLPMQFLAYKLNWVWPLALDCPTYQFFIANSLAFFFVSSYFFTVLAECLYIREHKTQVAKVAEGACTAIVAIQYAARILRLIFCQSKMRNMLQEFYTKIYVHRSENNELHNECERGMRLVNMMTSMFVLTLTFIYLRVIVVIAQDPSSRSKPYFYPMNFTYDAQEPFNYAITSLYTGWVGLSTVITMGAEDCFICITLSYCVVRYKVLQRELNSLYADSLKALAKRPQPPAPNELHSIFCQKLRVIIMKQQMIDRFSEQLQDFSGIMVFMLVSFGVFLLCGVTLQLAKTEFSMRTLQYICWFLSQSSEFLVIGSVGQRYTDAAGHMADSYYMCNWESLLVHGDGKANARLIKDISFAIYRSQKSVHLNGMGFVILSLKNIGLALKSSLSYFMFLNTMEDITNKRNANK